MRVLLISAHYQQRSVGARRARQIHAGLVEAGAQVEILCAAGAESPTAGALTVPAVRWGSIARAVTGNRGAEPLFTQWSGAPSTGGGGSPRVRALRLLRGTLMLPDDWGPWAALAGLRARTSGVLDRVDAIVSTGPPFSSLVLGAALARRAGVPWLADIRDPWTRNGIYPPSGERPLKEWLERRVLGSAACLTTVSEGFADLQQELGPRPQVVRNGWSPEDRAPARPPGPADPLRLVHTGTYYPGTVDMRPLALACAAQRAVGARIELVHCGRGGAALARDLGAALRPLDLGLVSRSEAAALRAGASALLLLVPSDPAQYGIVPAKLYDYLAAGLPLVSLGAPRGPDVPALLKLGQQPPATTSLEALSARLAQLIEAQTRGELERLGAPQSAVEATAGTRVGRTVAQLVEAMLR